jgi:UPF0755 protein
MSSPFGEFSTLSAEKSRKKSNLGFWIALAIFVLMVGFLYFEFRPQSAVGETPTQVGSAVVEIEIQPGASITEIGNVLKSAKVLATTREFVQAAADNPQSSQIGPGRYLIQQGISADQAIIVLLNPDSRIGVKIVVPEGARSSQVATNIANALEIERDEVLAIMADRELVPLPDWVKGNIEGTLYPATYRFEEGVSAEEILNTIVTRFNRAVEVSNLLQRAELAELDPYDVLIMASIIEKEVPPVDFPKAARVMLNRLARGMLLQVDATLNYGLDTNTLVFNSEELAQPNDYNTYLNPGLPPTPISNPSETSLSAVLNPEEGEWLYWVTINLDTKETKFAVTNDEFLVYKREFQEWYRQSLQS